MLEGVDWSQTAIGAVERWPDALLEAVAWIGKRRTPIVIWWGPELVTIANEAAKSWLGGDDASGQHASVVWRAYWPSFEEDVARARQRVPVVAESVRLPREPATEPAVRLTHVLTALDDGHGGVGGLLQVCLDETRRVRADEAPRLILDSVTGSVFAVNSEWRFTFANAAAEQLLGRTPGSLLGKLIWEEFPGLLGSEFERAYRQVMDSRLAATVSGFYPDSNRWYEVHVYPAAAVVDGISMYFHDVTRQMRVEEALRQNTALLQAVSDTTGDVIFAKDRDGRMLFANPAALALIGKTADRVIGRTDAEFLEDADAARAVMENDRRVMESGGPVDVDEPVPLADGTRRIWLSRKLPHRDAEGRVIGILGVSRDVTDQRRGWQRLRGLYDVVASLSEVASVEELGRVTLQQGIVALGASAGSLALLDEGGETLTMVGMVGYPPDSVERWRTFALASSVPLAEAVRRREPIYIRSAEQRLAAYPELRTLHPEVGTRSSVCLPLIIGGNAVGALGLSFEDESAFSEEDRDFILSLSRQCAQALDRIRLFDGERRARQQAELASRMKDEFLATLSHELRTPLNAILGWATVLSGRADADVELSKGLATIQRNARAQTRIIEDLLDMSRIINGKVRLEIQECDVGQVLRDAVETVRPAADAKGIRVRVVLDPDASPVSGDAARLQQVFWNLLTNAIKFTPRGGHVHVELARADSHLEITVADTGEGIDAAFLPYVFDRFRQADGGMTRRHGGLGLGLAIAKQLIELHGGTVRVNSPGAGQGATFTVDVPAGFVLRDSELDGMDRLHAAAPPSEREAAAERVQLSGLQVLVVDDEADARGLLEALLEARGAIVSSAASSEEAMACIARRTPDVVVSDIGMPGEDGYALIRRIRELPQAPIACVALTAYARTEDRVRILRAGFQAHIEKPVEAEQLVAILANVTGRMFDEETHVEPSLDDGSADV